MDERETRVRAAFSGLSRALAGFFDHLDAVDLALPDPAGPGDDDPVNEARVALDCARVDHLRPLLETLVELSLGKIEPEPTAPPDRHGVFQDYFSRLEPDDLPALRHLLACPLCRQLARLVLAPGPGFRPGDRRR